MQLTIKQQVMELPNNRDSIQIIEQHVNKEIQDSADEFFSHFIVDGEEVFENYGIYMEDKLTSITSIEAVFKTIDDFIEETMLELRAYLERAIPILRAYSEELYEGKGLDDSRLVDMLDGFQWINRVVATLDQTKSRMLETGSLVTIDHKVQGFYADLEAAIENADAILLADLLQYEFLPLLVELQKEAKEQSLKAGFQNEQH